jgi:hypothetical protein
MFRDRRSASIAPAFSHQGPAGECQGFAGQSVLVADATVPTHALKHGQPASVRPLWAFNHIRVRFIVRALGMPLRAKC